LGGGWWNRPEAAPEGTTEAVPAQTGAAAPPVAGDRDDHGWLDGIFKAFGL